VITGEVTPFREAVIELTISGPAGSIAVQCVVDTGFTESLILPPNVVTQLELPFVNNMPLVLAGGTEKSFPAHFVWVDWDGEHRRVLVYKADGDPLVGVGLLKGFHLGIDWLDGGYVTVSRITT